jgi:hypothetical protein
MITTNEARCMATILRSWAEEDAAEMISALTAERDRLLAERRDVAEAVAAERERCAKVARNCPSPFAGTCGFDKQDVGFLAACKDISANILEGNHNHD